MINPVFEIGNGKWAINENLILGYTNIGTNYIPQPASFTRATSGILLNSRGLIEDSCYNISQFSEELDNAYWIKSNATITTNNTTDPNGLLLADKLVENSVNTFHRVATPSYTIYPLTTYTCSVYAKAGERTKFFINNSDGLSGLTALFDLVAVTTNNPANSSITSVGNGWFRCSVTRTMGVTVGGGILQISMADASGNINYLGDGVSGMYFWGTQIEQGSLRNYLKTTTRLNVPRIDFTETSVRKNMLNYSEEFDNAAWSRFQIQTVTTNTINSPIGTLTADKIIPNTFSAQHRIHHVFNPFLPNTYTYSIYAKAGEYTGLYLRLVPTIGGSVGARFDLNLGTITLIDNAIAAISNEGNGWYRCSITVTTTTTGSYSTYTNILPDGLFDISTNYSGDGVSGFYLWGAQLEINYTATYYQPTTTVLVNLYEPKRNLLNFSEEFNHPIWVSSGVGVSVLPNIIANPIDGYLNADKIFETTATSTHRLIQDFNIIGTNFVFSVYLKAGERNTATIRLTDSAVATYAVNCDLINGTVNTVAPNTTASMSHVGNGWHRCILNLTNVTSIINAQIYVNNATSYTGDGISGIYAWGAQLELGLLTTYQKVSNINISTGAYLLEPARTNALLWSEDFSNVAWIKNNTTITANTNLNPFNIGKGFFLAEDTNNTSHNIAQSTSITTGNSYSFSYYVKKAAHSWVQFTHLGTVLNSSFWVNFNFDTGLFGNNGGVGTYIAKKLANGYWLITISNTATGTTTTSVAAIVGTNDTDASSRLPVYTGTGANICEVAAIQMEVGSNATTYIPTTTATVTRNAESSFFDMQPMGILNPNAFTLYCEGFFNKTSGSPAITLILSDDSTTSGSNSLGFSSGFVGHFKIAGSSAGTGASLIDNSSYKTIMQYNNGSVKWFRNGVQLGATQAVPVFNYRYLVATTGNSTYNIKSLKLYDRTLSDSECITMTTI